MSHDVFISHSSIDKSIADAVTAALEQAKIRCWIAPRDIMPGESWGGSIIEAIENSQVMVIIFSSNSNDSKQVMREVERAVQKDVVVVPFRVENIQPSRDMEYFLSATHWLDAVSPAMDEHLQGLVDTTQTLLDKRKSGKSSRGFTQPQAASVAANNTIPTPAKKSKTPFMLGGFALLLVGAIVTWLFSGDADKPGNEASIPSSKQASSEPATLARNLAARSDGSIKLQADDEVTGASELLVSWKGPSASDDFILISKTDAQDRIYLHRKQVGNGSEAKIMTPDQPGKYELRYQDSAGGSIIAKRIVEVTRPEVSLASIDVIDAGKPFSVEWAAPNNKYDYLSIAELDSDGNKYLSYAYTQKGSPTEMRAPDRAGRYELRYISAQSKAIWATKVLEVIANAVSIEAPSEAVAGSELEIKWQGPANKSDYLSVAETGSDGNAYLTYRYVKAGQATKLKMPEQEGDFEIRYISGQKKEIWASSKITLSLAEVKISIPDTALAGSKVDVDWTGPANPSDYISVAETGSDSNQYLSYQYVKAGKSVTARMPDSPGTYEVRYISGQQKNAWATAKIEVTARQEVLTLPEKIKAGEKFSVNWNDPGNSGEYLGVYQIDAGVKDYESYHYTDRKTKTNVQAPAKPGKYELRYISGKEDLEWAKAYFEVTNP